MRSAFVLCLIPILLLLSACQAQSAYPGFSDPIGGFKVSADELIFESVSNEKTLTVETSDSAVYMYYYVSLDGSDWQLRSFAGNDLGGNWLTGDVTSQMTLTASNFSLGQGRMSSDRNFIVVYSCTRQGGSWDCHGGWQIIQLSAALSESVSGLLANGFENGEELALPFTSVADGTLHADDSVSYRGDYSLRMECDGGHCMSGPDAGLDGAVSQDYGEVVNFSAFVRSDTPLDGQIGILCLGDDYLYYGHETDNGFRFADFTATGTWTQVSVTYTCPSWTEYIGVRLSSRDVGTMWFDDPVLGAGGECTPDCSGKECGDDGCAGTCGDCESLYGEGYMCSYGTCIEQGGSDDMEVVYYNNFEQDTPGPYLQAEYEHDWQLASFVTGYNSMFHESSIYSNPSDTVNPTKIFRNDFGAGHYWCNWHDCFNGEHYFDEGYDELYLSYKMKWTSGYQGSKGKVPSLRGQITSNESGAGQCVTGVDGFSGRFMFYGGYGATYLHFYPYHMQNWNGSFYSDEFYQSKGVYPKDCYEVMEYVCYNWYCRVSDIWNSAPFASELSGFVATYGRDPTSTLEFAIFIHQRDYEGFVNKYGRAPIDCLEFVLFVRHNHVTSLCGVYSGSGRAAERTEMESNVWHLITQRVVVNDVGHANGFVEIFIDGVFADRLTGLEFRSVEELNLNSIGFDGYFGGDEQDAPPQDVRMYIDDVIAYYYAPGSGEPIGHIYSPEGRVLPEIEYPQDSII